MTSTEKLQALIEVLYGHGDELNEYIAEETGLYHAAVKEEEMGLFGGLDRCAFDAETARAVLHIELVALLRHRIKTTTETLRRLETALDTFT